MRKKQIISVFGNELFHEDNLATRLVPSLSAELPSFEFRVEDPTENLEPAGDPWIILDVGIGIDEVTLVDDLSQLEYVKGDSVHDYDVYMDLKLKEKIGQLPRIKIILLPAEMDKKAACGRVISILSAL